MFDLIVGIFASIFAVTFIVGIHEWSHLWVGRLCGIKVLSFSIGFGKSVWHHRAKSGIDYFIRLIPLGGYVKFLDSREGEVDIRERDQEFNSQSRLKRFLVVFAGPLANILFAIVAYWFTYVIGFSTPIPIVGKVMPNSITAKADVKTNDQIVKIDNTPVESWRDVTFALISRLGEKTPIIFTTLHEGKSQNHSLDISDWKFDEKRPVLFESLGFIPYIPPNALKSPELAHWDPAYLHRQQFSFFQGLPRAVQETYKVSEFNGIVLKKLVTGVISLKSLGGPLSLFQGLALSSKQGFILFLRFLAFVSASLAFVNLLPIPGLDGGHLLFIVLETLRGKPLAMETQLFLFRIGIIFLIFLILQSIVNDLLRFS